MVFDIPDEKLSGFLVATNLTESDGTRLVAMRLLDTSGAGGRLASGLGGELLSWCLATWEKSQRRRSETAMRWRMILTGGFTGGLLGTSHG